MNPCCSRSRNRSVLPLLVFCLALAIITFAGSTLCQASNTQVGNLIFILDASGSMGAQVQGKIKIDVAKEALSGLIKDLPSGINTGLVVFGHRQKTDCNDVEELSPLGPLQKEALTGKIKGINPKGMTPITLAVQKVAEDLKAVEGESTIILVSDGEETCKGDPCAMVRSLKASGTKFVLHVIGFDVSEKEKAQLACIAEAGGGSYFAAKNAGELNVAARKAVEKTEQSAGRLKMIASRNGKPMRAYCIINKAGGSDEQEAEKIDEGWVAVESTTFKLTPGIYDIKVQNNDDSNSAAVTFSGITIEAGKSVEKVAEFSGGTIKVKAMKNGKPLRAYCEIYKTGGEEDKNKVAEGWTEAATGTTFKLTPGVYDVKVDNLDEAGKPSVSFQRITVEAGKNIEKVAEFSGGTLKVRALRNAKPLRAYCEIYKTDGEDDKEKVVEGWAEVEGTVFKLSPGAYDVKVENQEDSNMPRVTFAAVTIEAGKSVEKVAEFSGGTLKVKALRNGKVLRAYCEIYKSAGEEDSEKEKVTEGWIETEGTSFHLTPGTYDAAVECNNPDEKKEFKGITIEADKVQTFDAPF